MIFFRKFWKSITWIIIIFILSSISGNSLNQIPKFDIPHLDKIVHFVMYFVLTIVLILDFSHNKKTKLKHLLLIILFSVSYGILMEFMQEYIFIKRTADFNDFLANTVGSIIGFITISLYLKD